MAMKNTPCFTLLIVLIILLATITAACVTPASPAPSGAPAPALTSMKVGYQPIISFGPLFISKEEGFFEQQGIAVEMVKFSSASESLPALINGDIAVSGGQLNPGLINAIHEGAHVRVVADKGIILSDSCTSAAILVRRDLFESGAVTTVSDLRGRKVAAGTDQPYTMFRALALGNLTTNDVEMIDMPRPSILVAFENGAIDAGFLMEPYITEAVRRNKSVVLVKGYDFTPNNSNPLYYGTAIIKTNPELGKRFMVAYLQGVRQYNQGKTERNLEILAKYTQLDRDVLNETCWVYVAENGEVPEAPVREFMDWMYANKKITHTIDMDQLIDRSYVQYANGVLGNMTGNISQDK